MKNAILAGDIGGTKTQFALFHADQLEEVAFFKYDNSKYSEFSDIVTDFIEKNSDYSITKACFGLAGVIKDQTCQLTNIPWFIDASLIKKQTRIDQVFLINDLKANAYGIDSLKPPELFCVNKGVKKNGNRALISPGTGLGEAGLYFDGKDYHPFAGEGGHCSFAPANDLEIRLLQYLRKEFEHVSFERIISGSGLYHLYRFIIDEKIEKENQEVKLALTREDPAKIISEMALQSKCTACVQTIKLFMSIFGSESANLALKMLAIGGLYIGGGMAPKMIEFFKQDDFIRQFLQKGRFSSLLQDIPVFIILNEKAALRGAAHYLENLSFKE